MSGNRSIAQESLSELRSSTSVTSLGPIINNSEDNDIRLSKKRWLVLFALSIFGLSIALTGDTSPILHLILKLLDLRIDKYLYISQLFYYLMAVSAVPMACFIDKCGIKMAVHAASLLFVLHGIFRSLLYYPDLEGWSSNKLFYWIASSFLGTLMYSIFFLLPLKVSESWFAESERSIAWTIMISQLNVGVCLASFIYPKLMVEVMDIKLLAYINIVCVSTSALVIAFLINRSEPEHPPNKRVAKASKDTTPYTVAFLKMLKHKQLIIHLLHNAIFESVIISISGALQDILTSVGQTDIFAGNFMAISALVSLIMQVILAGFVHKIRNITLACKSGSVLTLCFLIMYLLTLILAAPGWVIMSVAILWTISKSWLVPHNTNMTAHLSCGTVSQATVIGFSMTIVVITMTVIQTTFVSLIKISNKKSKQSNYNHAILFLALLSVLNDVIYLIFFQPKPTKHLDTRPEDESIEESP